MFKTTVSDGAAITVQSRKHTYNYAIDNSLPNPLEATYAALVGCAGVYALKASKKINKSINGVEIEGKLVVKPDNPAMPQKWITTVHFPDGWSTEEKSYIMKEIKNCAVKELILNGANIEFIDEII